MDVTRLDDALIQPYGVHATRQSGAPGKKRVTRGKRA